MRKKIEISYTLIFEFAQIHVTCRAKSWRQLFDTENNLTSVSTCQNVRFYVFVCLFSHFGLDIVNFRRSFRFKGEVAMCVVL